MTVPQSRLLIALIGAVLIQPLGCGKGDPAASTAEAAAAPSGRAVGKADQIRGGWMAVTDGQLAGIEFLKDDQALLTAGSRRETLTLTYSLLDEGRVSLVNAQGQTTIYKASLADGVLELDDQNSGATPQRFQRLTGGQTLAEAMAAHETKILAEMEQRILKLRDQLLKGNTVITTTEGEDPWVMAVRFDDPNHSLDGSMVLDTPLGGRNDSLNPIRVLPVRADTARVDTRSNRIRIVLNAGPATEPAGQQEVSGQVQLTIDGPIDRPTISGEARFPKLWPSPRPVVLKTDQDLHAGPIAKLEDQREAIAAEINRMKDFLGGRSVFTGVRTASANPGAEPEQVRLVVERNEQDNAYETVITSGNRVDQPGQAGVDLVLGTAALYVITPWGEQWRLQTTDQADTLDGLWRPNARADFLSHGSVDLTLERRWTAEEVAAEREAIRQYLAQDLRSPQRFTGFVERQFGATNITRWPVSVELQVTDENTLAGSAWMIAQQGGVTFAGTMNNGSANLTSSSVMENSVDFGSFASQRWQLAFAGLDPAPTFVGQLTGPRHGGGRVVLTAATAESFADGRQLLIEALSDRAYTSRKTDTSTVRDEQTNFHFSIDSDGQVTAEIHGAGDLWRAVPPAIFTGTIIEDHGMPVLKGTVAPAPDPDRGGGEDYEPFEIILCTVDIDGVVRLTGSTPPGPGNQSWFILEPMDGNATVEPNPVHTVRLAALRAGASAEEERFTNPQPGDEALFIVSITERDLRGQLFYADGKYTHRNSVAAAALHAGLAQPGETAIFRLTYGPPFTEPVVPIEQNGVTSQRANFRADNPFPTYTLERVSID